MTGYVVKVPHIQLVDVASYTGCPPGVGQTPLPPHPHDFYRGGGMRDAAAGAPDVNARALFDAIYAGDAAACIAAVAADAGGAAARVPLANARSAREYRGGDGRVLLHVGDTSLIAAANRRLPEVCSALLRGCGRGADLSAADWYGDTALICAARRGLDATCLELIDAGAPVSTANKGGTTALMAAAKQGLYGVCVALIQRGADVAHVDNSGRTALDHAAPELRDNLADYANLCSQAPRAIRSVIQPRQQSQTARGPA